MTLKYRAIAIAAAIAICIANTGALAAATYSDMSGHPDLVIVQRWSDYDVLEGTDGIFNPDGLLTRAQLAVVLQRIIKHPTEAENKYSDLINGEWYTEDALKMLDLGVMKGDGTRFMPKDTLTREMAVSALAQAFSIESNPDLTMFSDGLDISLWAARGVGAMASAGYIEPYSDGTFRPKAAVTRLEFIKILDAMFEGYYYTAGKYPTKIINSNALINSDNTTCFFLRVNNNIYVTSGAGSGDVYLYGCKVDDTVYLNGGGKVTIMGSMNDTIYQNGGSNIQYVDPNSMTIPDVTSSTYTSMVIGTLVNRVVVNAPWDMTIFASVIAGVKEVEFVRPDRSYKFEGKTDILKASAKNISVELSNAHVVKLIVNAPGLSITGKSSIIQDMTISHPVTLSGVFTMNKVTVESGGSGSILPTKPVVMTLKPGASVTINDKVYTNTGSEDVNVY